MLSLPPTLKNLCPCSHASCLPRLAVVLPLVLCHLSFLLHHCLPSSSAPACPPLAVPLPLILPLFFSGAVASCLPRLVVVSPLITPPSSIRLNLCLSLHHHLSLCPSHAIAYQHIVHKCNKNFLWPSCRQAHQQHTGNPHDENCHLESSCGGHGGSEAP